MTAPLDWTDWQAARRAALCAPDGWLNLTDRVEIPPGSQRVGRGAGNDLMLSVGPEHLGVLERAGEGAVLTAPDGAAHEFRRAGGNPVLALPGLLLELHDAGDGPALRVRDTLRKPQISLRYFDYDPSWNILAEWQELPEPQAHQIGKKGGGEDEVTVTHRAVFARAGQTHALLATHWKAGAPMFVIRDATSGKTTYAASRFLIGEVSGSTVRLDFNRAHNPPCAFTDFAICPLPPPENRFAGAVEAGELVP
jgi:uncharacterized protein (DUF1684 family)